MTEPLPPSVAKGCALLIVACGALILIAATVWIVGLIL